MKMATGRRKAHATFRNVVAICVLSCLTATFSPLLLQSPGGSGMVMMVEAHGYMKSPRSRNYVAYKDGVWWGGTDSTPAAESCPHCLNLGGTISTCGKAGDDGVDYAFPPSSTGTILSHNVQGTFAEGDEIEIDIVLTAHHKGHFSFKACPLEDGDVVATQDCFDAHPLEFVQDNLYNAVKDDDYPDRAYIPPTTYPGLVQDGSGFYGTLYSYRYKLPMNLHGDVVLLQWHYLTANSCSHEGYDNYAWPENYDNEHLAVCDSIPPDGRGVPEQFWNCAELKIIADDTSGTTTTSTTTTTTTSPATTTTSATTVGPTGSTTTTTTTSTTAATTTAATTTTTTDATTPPPQLGNYCGSTWFDALDTCQNTVPCPDGNSTTCRAALGQGVRCFADVPCSVLDTTTASPTTTATTTTTSTTTNNVEGPLVASNDARCGTSELDAREYCKTTCSHSIDCPTGESCYVTHGNYCAYQGVKPTWGPNPVISNVNSRCGIDEVDAREFCRASCVDATDCDSARGEGCHGVNVNFCGSETV